MKKVSKTKKVATVAKKKAVMSDLKMVARNEKIRKLYASGKYTCRSLAEKMSMSKSRIHEIVN